MAKPNTREYVKKFVSPLLALAFKEGIDYVGDPNFRALEPTKEGPNEWEIIIEHDLSDEDDGDEDGDITIYPAPFGPSPDKNKAIKVDAITEKTPPTFKDYEERLKNMIAISAKPAPNNKEIIHLPVKLEEISEDVLVEIDNSLTEHTSQAKIPSGKVIDGRMGLWYDLSTPLPEPRIKSIIADLDETEPCGKCIPCSMGTDCIEVISAGCRAMGHRSER